MIVDRRGIVDLLFAVALVSLYVGVRLAYLHFTGSLLLPPSPSEGQRAAVCLAEKGYFGDIFLDDSGKSAHVAPLYPWLLSRIYIITGSNTPLAGLVQRWAAIVAGVFTLLLLPVLARALKYPPWTGWLAALSMAAMPFSLWIETSGNWEQPWAALVLLLLILMHLRMRSLEWRSPTSIVVWGGLVGIAGLLSPPLLPAVAFMGFAEFVLSPVRRLRIASAGLAMCVIALAIMLPWCIRNYRVFQAFTPIRSSFGLELVLGHHDDANGLTFPLGWDQPDDPNALQHPFCSASEAQKLLRLGELEYMASRQREAFSWIRRHPVRSMGLVAQRFRLYWMPPPWLWSPGIGLRFVRSVVFVLVGCLAFVGLFVVGRRSRIDAGVLFGALVGPSLPYLITHVDARYRYLTLSLSVLIASISLTHALLWLGKSFRRVFKESGT